MSSSGSVSSEIIKSIIRDVAQKATNLIKAANINSNNAASDSSVTVQSALRYSSAPWQVTETLSAFVLRSVVLNPNSGLNLETALSCEDVERITAQCVSKIVATNDPETEALKMQVYFDTTFPVQADFLHKEKATKLNIAQSYLKEITDFKQKTISGYENLYCKIVSYIMIRNQLNPATDLTVVRETSAALESVYPQSELGLFISMPRAEKEAQLNGLVLLVTGIRLFNRHLKKGGLNIEDLPEKCHEMLKLLNENILCGLADSRQQIELLTKAVESRVENRLVHGLIFHHQLCVYLSAMQDIAKSTIKTLQTIDNKFAESLTALKETCQARSAVPVDQVYPNFITLANLWINYQDELFCVAFRQGMVDTLLKRMSSFNLSDALEKFEPLAESLPEKADAGPRTEEQVVAAAKELMAQVTVSNRQVEVLHPLNYTQFSELCLEYGGFCPVTLVSSGGLVVPANREIGLLRYHEKAYGFRTTEAALQFARNPQYYVENVVNLAKHFPDLVELLQLYSFFPTVETLEKVKSYTRERLLGRIVVRSDTSSQTDTHISDSYIDPKYQWNEWELRRQAIMLVNLRKKATHSTQTKSSSFKRDSETQVYLPKENSSQTVQDSSTQVAPIRNYFSGLRHKTGKPSSFKVVNINLNL